MPSAVRATQAFRCALGRASAVYVGAVNPGPLSLRLGGLAAVACFALALAASACSPRGSHGSDGTLGSGGSSSGGTSSSAAGSGGSRTGGSGGGGGPGNGGTAGSCSSVDACGGEVVGAWTVTSSCLTVSGNLDLSNLSGRSARHPRSLARSTFLARGAPTPTALTPTGRLRRATSSSRWRTTACFIPG